MQRAREVAGAQVDITRLRRLREQLVEQQHHNDDHVRESTTSIDCDLVRKFLALDRYERRALSRRNKAIERFDATRVVEAAAAEKICN